ncbi:hypothetical protein [Klebsiella oxytoca]|uniref:hypothetical protein n=1 Tax=Klebsiella oxytoca TaxID=571 RepID=UPI003CEF9378
MTNDITELAQMKGQKVEGSYYLAECTDCGKMYPSNKLNGGEPLFSGDYGECHCPHCNADDAAIGDCGDTAAIAWNYQQGRIDALVEALEKSEKTSEGRREAIDITHKRAARERDRANAAEEALEKAQETIAFQQGEIKALLSSLESRAVTAENLQESAYRAGLTAGWNFGLENNNDGFNKCLAAHAYGIKWEAE